MKSWNKLIKNLTIMLNKTKERIPKSTIRKLAK